MIWNLGNKAFLISKQLSLCNVNKSNEGQLYVLLNFTKLVLRIPLCLTLPLPCLLNFYSNCLVSSVRISVPFTSALYFPLTSYFGDLLDMIIWTIQTQSKFQRSPIWSWAVSSLSHWWVEGGWRRLESHISCLGFLLPSQRTDPEHMSHALPSRENRTQFSPETHNLVGIYSSLISFNEGGSRSDGIAWLLQSKSLPVG